MDWLHETYRRIYVRADARWLALPAMSRGIGYALLTVADDDGFIPAGRGESIADTVVRVLAAHASERRRVVEAVEDLLIDGYLQEVDGHGLIRNFVAAQGTAAGAEERSVQHSAAAKRQSRYRAKKREARYAEASRVTSPVTRNGDGVGDVTGDVAGDVTGDPPGDVTLSRAGVARARAGGSPSVPSVPSIPEERESARDAREGPPNLTAAEREVRVSLEAGRDLYPPPDVTDAHVDAAARRLAGAITGEPKAADQAIGSIVADAVAKLRTEAAKTPHATPTQVFARLDEVTRWMLDRIRKDWATPQARARRAAAARGATAFDVDLGPTGVREL